MVLTHNVRFFSSLLCQHEIVIQTRTVKVASRHYIFKSNYISYNYYYQTQRKARLRWAVLMKSYQNLFSVPQILIVWIYCQPNLIKSMRNNTSILKAGATASHSVSHPLYEMTGSAINLQNANNCSFVININK